MTKFVVIVETTDLTKDVYGGYRSFKRAEADALAWSGTVEPVLDPSEHAFKPPPDPMGRYTQGYNACMTIMMDRVNYEMSQASKSRSRALELEIMLSKFVVATRGTTVITPQLLQDAENMLRINER